MHIGICDDDQTAVEELMYFLTAWGKQRNVSLSYFTCNQAEDLLRDEQPTDLLFLDMHLPGMEGVKAAEMLNNKSNSVPIVFFTAFSDYMRSAFKLHAFDYLEKPVTQERIDRLMDDFYSLLQERIGQELIFETLEGTERFNSGDIYYFERVGRSLYLIDGLGKHSLRTTLNNIYSQLDNRIFIYVHKGAVVNMHHIRKVVKNDITMDDGHHLLISRPRMREFQESWNTFIRQQRKKRQWQVE